MKVSIIISNYNYARYLKAAVDSVVTQTHKNIEIIIVDDGSTDNSSEVIAQLTIEYPDKINAIFQANQGQGVAFNTGFAAATGEIIAFLDADDVWADNKLERILKEFRTPEIVGVMHSLESIDASGNRIDSDVAKKLGLSEDLAQVVLNTGNAWSFPPTSGLAYRRSTLLNVFPIDGNKWRLWADGCLIYCTAFLGKIKTLNENLAYYRIHGANNHMNSEKTSAYEGSVLLGIEMTNLYINQFLASINYPQRVKLSRNLQYRRVRYYMHGVFNFREAWEISLLILGWQFYTRWERVYYLVRFLMKNAKFILHPATNIEKVFAD
jgi:glycosyltransferase involved in cell wall biosynthesis